NILQIEIPYSLLSSLITTREGKLPLAERYRVPDKYRLKPESDEHPSPSASGVQVTTPPDTRPDIPKPTPEVSTVPLQVLFGHDATRQTPLFWEPTNTTKFMNTNTGIIGTMGTGKTQFTKSLVTQLMRNQSCNVDGKSIGLLIFDYKSDYVDEAFLKATGGKKYQLSLLPYNPLSLFGDMPMLPRHTAIAFSETMGKAYNLGVKQRMKLVTLIMECYELAGIVPHDRSTWNRV
ncbi:DUF87 domain-containing protein, partial [Escherichia coli]